MERLRLRRGSTGRGNSLLRNRQGPSILLELIGLVNLLTGVTRIRGRLRFWSGLGVLGVRSLSLGELVREVVNRLPIGVVPGLVGAGSRTDFRDWLLLDLGLDGRRARGACQSIEWGRKFEQSFASRRFRALLLPLWTSGLRSGFRDLLYGLVYLREVVLISLRPRMLLLRLGWEEGRGGGDRRRRGLRKRRGRVREVGDRSSAEVREVRNGLKTIGDGSQRG